MINSNHTDLEELLGYKICCVNYTELVFCLVMLDTAVSVCALVLKELVKQVDKMTTYQLYKFQQFMPRHVKFSSTDSFRPPLGSFFFLDGAFADMLADDLLNAGLVVQRLEHGKAGLIQLVLQQLAALDVGLGRGHSWFYICLYHIFMYLTTEI